MGMRQIKTGSSVHPPTTPRPTLYPGPDPPAISRMLPEARGLFEFCSALDGGRTLSCLLHGPSWGRLG